MVRQANRLKCAFAALGLGGLALCAIDASAADGVDDVIAVGPVDSVASSGREFFVLGRHFNADGQVALSVGEYVAVHGSLYPDGTVTEIWVESLGTYVPGSDVVYEKGVVSEVKPYLGQLSIAGSRLDYTASMYSATGVTLTLGSIVAASGIQPTASGAVLVDNLMASADRVRDSLMKGGGVQSSLMKGGGVQSSLMKGGGVQSSLMKGGGVQSSLMKGGGVQPSLMKGGGSVGT